MRYASSLLTVLFLVASLVRTTFTIAAEKNSPSANSREVNVVRQVATALAAGRDGVQNLRGRSIENSTLDQLNLPTPGMDCGIDRAFLYIECQSASLNKKEAEALFSKIMDDVKTALPSDSWKQLEGVPFAGLVRTISYFHRETAAQIDIDMMAQPATGEEQMYWVRVFGWRRA